mgnify:CR=1 FL=1
MSHWSKLLNSTEFLARSVWLAILASLALAAGACTVIATESNEPLRFAASEDGSFTFNTGLLSGVLRQDGMSTGLVPVAYEPNGVQLAAGEGLFNHYRVFTHGKRYGYGARRWPSTAELHDDGSVEVTWPTTSDRPFELRAIYRWSAPNVLDLQTIVSAEQKLEAFEVFLSSYYRPSFVDSRIWATRDPRGGSGAGFVSADRELGEWLAFPRDEQAAAVIDDGRWALEPHPLGWTLMPNFAAPVAIRRDPGSGLTVVVMSHRNDAFGLFTPYGEEDHISNYISLFGMDVGPGEIEIAHSRLVVLQSPTDAEILEYANVYLDPDS